MERRNSRAQSYPHGSEKQVKRKSLLEQVKDSLIEAVTPSWLSEIVTGSPRQSQSESSLEEDQNREPGMTLLSSGSQIRGLSQSQPSLYENGQPRTVEFSQPGASQGIPVQSGSHSFTLPGAAQGSPSRDSPQPGTSFGSLNQDFSQPGSSYGTLSKSFAQPSTSQGSPNQDFVQPGTSRGASLNQEFLQYGLSPNTPVQAKSQNYSQPGSSRSTPRYSRKDYPQPGSSQGTPFPPPAVVPPVSEFTSSQLPLNRLTDKTDSMMAHDDTGSQRSNSSQSTSGCSSMVPQSGSGNRGPSQDAAKRRRSSGESLTSQGTQTPPPQQEAKRQRLQVNVSSVRGNHPQNITWTELHRQRMDDTPIRDSQPHFKPHLLGSPLHDSIRNDPFGPDSPFRRETFGMSNFYPGPTRYMGRYNFRSEEFTRQIQNFGSNRRQRQQQASQQRSAWPYPTRHVVRPKPRTTEQEPVLGSTARRISDVLNSIKTPMSDARKIPVIVPDYWPGLRRYTDFARETPRNLGPPTGGLQVSELANVIPNRQVSTGSPQPGPSGRHSPQPGPSGFQHARSQADGLQNNNADLQAASSQSGHQGNRGAEPPGARSQSSSVQNNRESAVQNINNQARQMPSSQQIRRAYGAREENGDIRNGVDDQENNNRQLLRARRRLPEAPNLRAAPTLPLGNGQFGLQLPPVDFRLTASESGNHLDFNFSSPITERRLSGNAPSPAASGAFQFSQPIHLDEAPQLGNRTVATSTQPRETAGFSFSSPSVLKPGSPGVTAGTSTSRALSQSSICSTGMTFQRMDKNKPATLKDVLASSSDGGFSFKSAGSLKPGSVMDILGNSDLGISKVSEKTNTTSAIDKSSNSGFSFRPAEKLKQGSVMDVLGSGLGFKAAEKLKRGSVMDNLGDSNVGYSFKPAEKLKQGSVMDILGSGSGFKPAEKLKQGSVMDILGGKSGTAQETSTTDLQRLTRPQTDSQTSTTDLAGPKSAATSTTGLAQTSVEAGTSTTGLATESESAKSNTDLASLFKPATGSWSCEVCLLQNKPDTTQCVACQTAKPGKKDSEKSDSRETVSEASKSSTSSAKSSDTSVADSSSSSSANLASLFKPASGSWSCEVCLVQNKPDTTQCVACQTSKPGKKGTESDKSSSNSLASLFKQASGSWSCEVCLVQNKPDTTQCVACQTPKPGNKEAVAKETKSEPIKHSWSCEVCLVTNEGSDSSCVACQTEKTAQPFKHPPGDWTCDTCMFTNKEAAVRCCNCEYIRPGPPRTQTVPSCVKTYLDARNKELSGSESAALKNSPDSKLKSSASLGSASSVTSSGFKFGGSLSSSSTVGTGFKFGNNTPGSEPQPLGTGLKLGSTSGSETQSVGTGFKLESASVSDKSQPSSVGVTTQSLGGFQFGSSVSSVGVSSTESALSSSDTQPKGFQFQFGNVTTSATVNSGFVFGSPSVTVSAKITSPQSTASSVRVTPTSASFTSSTASLFNFGSGSKTTQTGFSAPSIGGFTFSTNKTSTNTVNSVQASVCATAPTGGFTFATKALTGDVVQSSSATNEPKPSESTTSGGFNFIPAQTTAAGSSVFGNFNSAQKSEAAASQQPKPTESVTTGFGAGGFGFSAVSSEPPKPLPFGGFNTSQKPAETMPAGFGGFNFQPTQPDASKPTGFSFPAAQGQSTLFGQSIPAKRPISDDSSGPSEAKKPQLFNFGTANSASTSFQMPGTSNDDDLHRCHESYSRHDKCMDHSEPREEMREGVHVTTSGFSQTTQSALAQPPTVIENGVFGFGRENHSVGTRHMSPAPLVAGNSGSSMLPTLGELMKIETQSISKQPPQNGSIAGTGNSSELQSKPREENREAMHVTTSGFSQTTQSALAQPPTVFETGVFVFGRENHSVGTRQVSPAPLFAGSSGSSMLPTLGELMKIGTQSISKQPPQNGSIAGTGNSSELQSKPREEMREAMHVTTSGFSQTTQSALAQPPTVFENGVFGFGRENHSVGSRQESPAPLVAGNAGSSMLPTLGELMEIETQSISKQPPQNGSIAGTGNSSELQSKPREEMKEAMHVTTSGFSQTTQSALAQPPTVFETGVFVFGRENHSVGTMQESPAPLVAGNSGSPMLPTLGDLMEIETQSISKQPPQNGSIAGTGNSSELQSKPKEEMREGVHVTTSGFSQTTQSALAQPPSVFGTGVFVFGRENHSVGTRQVSPAPLVAGSSGSSMLPTLGELMKIGTQSISKQPPQNGSIAGTGNSSELQSKPREEMREAMHVTTSGFSQTTQSALAQPPTGFGTGVFVFGRENHSVGTRQESPANLVPGNSGSSMLPTLGNLMEIETSISKQPPQNGSIAGTGNSSELQSKPREEMKEAMHVTTSGFSQTTQSTLAQPPTVFGTGVFVFGRENHSVGTRQVSPAPLVAGSSGSSMLPTLGELMKIGTQSISKQPPLNGSIAGIGNNPELQPSEMETEQIIPYPAAEGTKNIPTSQTELSPFRMMNVETVNRPLSQPSAMNVASSNQQPLCAPGAQSMLPSLGDLMKSGVQSIPPSPVKTQPPACSIQQPPRVFVFGSTNQTPEKSTQSKPPVSQHLAESLEQTPSVFVFGNTSKSAEKDSQSKPQPPLTSGGTQNILPMLGDLIKLGQSSTTASSATPGPSGLSALAACGPAFTGLPSIARSSPQTVLGNPAFAQGFGQAYDGFSPAFNPEPMDDDNEKSNSSYSSMQADSYDEEDLRNSDNDTGSRSSSASNVSRKSSRKQRKSSRRQSRSRSRRSSDSSKSHSRSRSKYIRKKPKSRKSRKSKSSRRSSQSSRSSSSRSSVSSKRSSRSSSRSSRRSSRSSRGSSKTRFTQQTSRSPNYQKKLSAGSKTSLRSKSKDGTVGDAGDLYLDNPPGVSDSSGEKKTSLSQGKPDQNECDNIAKQLGTNLSSLKKGSTASLFGGTKDFTEGTDTSVSHPSRAGTGLFGCFDPLSRSKSMARNTFTNIFKPSALGGMKTVTSSGTQSSVETNQQPSLASSMVSFGRQGLQCSSDVVIETSRKCITSNSVSASVTPTSASVKGETQSFMPTLGELMKSGLQRATQQPLTSSHNVETVSLPAAQPNASTVEGGAFCCIPSLGDLMKNGLQCDSQRKFPGDVDAGKGSMSVSESPLLNAAGTQNMPTQPPPPFGIMNAATANGLASHTPLIPPAPPPPVEEINSGSVTISASQPPAVNIPASQQPVIPPPPPPPSGMTDVGTVNISASQQSAVSPAPTPPFGMKKSGTVNILASQQAVIPPAPAPPPFGMTNVETMNIPASQPPVPSPAPAPPPFGMKNAGTVNIPGSQPPVIPPASAPPLFGMKNVGTVNTPASQPPVILPPLSPVGMTNVGTVNIPTSQPSVIPPEPPLPPFGLRNVGTVNIPSSQQPVIPPAPPPPLFEMTNVGTVNIPASQLSVIPPAPPPSPFGKTYVGKVNIPASHPPVIPPAPPLPPFGLRNVGTVNIPSSQQPVIPPAPPPPLFEMTNVGTVNIPASQSSVIPPAPPPPHFGMTKVGTVNIPASQPQLDIQKVHLPPGPLLLSEIAPPPLSSPSPFVHSLPFVCRAGGMEFRSPRPATSEMSCSSQQSPQKMTISPLPSPTLGRMEFTAQTSPTPTSSKMDYEAQNIPVLITQVNRDTQIVSAQPPALNFGAQNIILTSSDSVICGTIPSARSHEMIPQTVSLTALPLEQLPPSPPTLQLPVSLRLPSFKRPPVTFGAQSSHSGELSSGNSNLSLPAGSAHGSNTSLALKVTSDRNVAACGLDFAQHQDQPSNDSAIKSSYGHKKLAGVRFNPCATTTVEYPAFDYSQHETTPPSSSNGSSGLVTDSSTSIPGQGIKSGDSLADALAAIAAEPMEEALNPKGHFANFFRREMERSKRERERGQQAVKGPKTAKRRRSPPPPGLPSPPRSRSPSPEDSRSPSPPGTPKRMCMKKPTSFRMQGFGQQANIGMVDEKPFTSGIECRNVSLLQQKALNQSAQNSGIESKPADVFDSRNTSGSSHGDKQPSAVPSLLSGRSAEMRQPSKSPSNESLSSSASTSQASQQSSSTRVSRRKISFLNGNLHSRSVSPLEAKKRTPVPDEPNASEPLKKKASPQGSPDPDLQQQAPQNRPQTPPGVKRKVALSENTTEPSAEPPRKIPSPVCKTPSPPVVRRKSSVQLMKERQRKKSTSVSSSGSDQARDAIESVSVMQAWARLTLSSSTSSVNASASSAVLSASASSSSSSTVTPTASNTNNSSKKGGFAFGSQAAPAPAAPFVFGATSAEAPTPAAPAPTPQPGFNFLTTPNINFGSATPSNISFSAGHTTDTSKRVVKKAVRKLKR